MIYKNEKVKSITITSREQEIFPVNEFILRNITRIKTKNTIDKYVIKYNSKNENYFAIYKRENFISIPKKNGIFRDKINEKIIAYNDTVNPIKVKCFLDNLVINNLKAEFNMTGMNYQEFMRLTDRQEIIRVIETNRIRRQVNEEDLKKINLDSIFNGFQSIDTFNLFLLDDFYITKPYDEIKERSLNGPQEFYVKIITHKSTYEYIGGIPNPYVRNWYNIKESYSCILNFFINTTLTEIVPLDFLAIETLGNKALVDRYVEWYLIRRGVIPIYYYID